MVPDGYFWRLIVEDPQKNSALCGTKNNSLGC